MSDPVIVALVAFFTSGVFAMALEGWLRRRDRIRRHHAKDFRVRHRFGYLVVVRGTDLGSGVSDDMFIEHGMFEFPRNYYSSDMQLHTKRYPCITGGCGIPTRIE